MTDKERLSASETDRSLAERYAALIVDALIDAGLVDRSKAADAIHIAATEIHVRRSMGDR